MYSRYNNDFNWLYVIIPVAVIGVIAGLFIAFYEPALVEGVVIEKTATKDTTEYIQHEEKKYRSERRRRTKEKFLDLCLTLFLLL